jgi:internalin A
MVFYDDSVYTSLLRALRNDMFDPQLSTTHGIEVNRLEISHPDDTIILNTWDFGGQHIYHSTHQFFLTKRSLYLVVWNARSGAEQGRLHYWLDTIQALAPDSPVLLVATHIDERDPDLNYHLYKEVYPQLVGNMCVSNKNRAGLAALKIMIIDRALQLPLMGQPLPQKWLTVEKVLLDRPEHHIDANTYIQYCTSCGVEVNIAKGELGNYLHDLGKILYFRDDYVLSNLVVLKPNWITKAISLVLEDKTTSMANGILLHSELPRIWATDDEGQEYEPYLYPVLLRLMERFELSYQIDVDTQGDRSTRSLIPQLLPLEPPVNLPAWPKTPAKGQAQVEMVYRLEFIPAGIMSRFIVRTHRYTQNLHWRDGVVLAYQDHQARVEFNPMRRELRLLVQGRLPQNFFTILMNTIDVILARFQGLIIERRIPCICHWENGAAEPCTHFYSYEELVRRMEAKRYKVECPQSFIEVSVPTLLYGIHISTDQQVMANIERERQEIEPSLKNLPILLERLNQLNQQSELIGRNFTRLWNLEMHKMEVDCPNTFILMPGSDNIFNPKNWVSQQYWLYLVCQHPSGPHRVGNGYRLRKAEEWWVAVVPWLNHLVTFLKFAVPKGAALGQVYDAAEIKQMQSSIGLMKEIIESLPEFSTLDSSMRLSNQLRPEQEQRIIGPALRALNSFLNEADPSQIWGGLYKTPTPDGNIMWLCDQHRQQYVIRALKLDV